MFEIRPQAASKAHAVLKVLADLEVENVTVNNIIYIGDDTTDEEAMQVLNHKYQNNMKKIKLKNQLQTIRVLNNTNKNKIKTCAMKTFKNTQDVLTFLFNL